MSKLFHAGPSFQLLRRTKSLAIKWGGLVIVLVGLILWFAVPFLTDWMATTAFARWLEAKQGNAASGLAWMDVSVFQTLLLSGIRAVALYCFSVLLVKVYIPAVSLFWKRHFVRVFFYQLTAWQKVIVSFWAVSLFVYICVSLTH